MGEIDTIGASTTDELKAPVDSGRYLAVFHRGTDGSWRYATDMWNSDAG
jgi:ketosteroid isomerase-like protein